MNWAMQKCPNSCTKICSNDFHYFYKRNERSYKPESACVDADHDDDDQQKLGSNKWWWWWWWRWWCDRKFRLQYSQNDNMIPFKYTGTSIKRRPRDWQNMFAITRFSLYRSSFPYILLLLGRKISFVIQRFVKSRFPHCIGVKQRAFLNWLAYKAKTLLRSKL